MDTFIPYQLKEILEDDLKKFKKYVNEINSDELNDDDDDDKLFSLYCFSLFDNMSALKQVKKKCIDSKKISEKDFNSFVYVSLKYIDKLNRGCWSFYEATILNIPAEEIRELTITYTIL